MSYENKIATIFGGTGFIGKQIVRELAALGIRVKVACRIPERAYELRPCGSVGQIVPVACDYSDDKSIASVVADSDFVINCVGILFQKRGNGFDRIHAELPARIAKACKKAEIERFVHISALGIESSSSKYAKSKLEGEKAVKKAFSSVTILRPSVVFGHDDNFFNMFAKMSMIMPALPLIGGGKTKFQPVYVGDVADAVIQALTMSDQGKNTPLGKTYELGGPEIVSFKQIYQRLFGYTGRPRALISIPYCAAKVQGCVLGILPNPPLTCDQVESLKTDSVVQEKAFDLKDLAITPTAMQSILPEYLGRFKAGGRYGTK